MTAINHNRRCVRCRKRVTRLENTCFGCGHVVCAECVEEGDHWLDGRHDTTRMPFAERRNAPPQWSHQVAP